MRDLRTDPRWPRYGPQAAALGLGAQMGITLHAPLPGPRGAQRLREAAADLRRGLRLGRLFAAHASLLLGFGSTINHYTSAMESRRTIGVAIGIVMERYTIDDDRAFAFLVRVSQDSNVKLREVAADIVTETRARSRQPEPGSG